MDEKQYTYDDLMRESVLEIADLILDDGYQLPLEITITDQAGRLVISMEMKSPQDCRNTSDVYNLPTNAILPFLVRITDCAGRVWEKTLGEN
jgi:hypothetical protein